MDDNAMDDNAMLDNAMEPVAGRSPECHGAAGLDWDRAASVCQPRPEKPTGSIS